MRVAAVLLALFAVAAVHARPGVAGTARDTGRSEIAAAGVAVGNPAPAGHVCVYAAACWMLPTTANPALDRIGSDRSVVRPRSNSANSKWDEIPPDHPPRMAG